MAVKVNHGRTIKRRNGFGKPFLECGVVVLLSCFCIEYFFCAGTCTYCNHAQRLCQEDLSKSIMTVEINVIILTLRYLENEEKEPQKKFKDYFSLNSESDSDWLADDAARYFAFVVATLQGLTFVVTFLAATNADL